MFHLASAERTFYPKLRLLNYRASSQQTMLSQLNKLFDALNAEPACATELREEELRIAAAALLVHAMVIDGEAASSEREKLSKLLMDRFNLAVADANKLIDVACERERDAVDLFGFTRILTRELDQDGRKTIVAMLWEVVLADGVIHEFENNLVWRAAELLGVSSRDRILLRKQAEQRQ